jgi:hypothetical protein
MLSVPHDLLLRSRVQQHDRNTLGETVELSGAFLNAAIYEIAS